MKFMERIIFPWAKFNYDYIVDIVSLFVKGKKISCKQNQTKKTTKLKENINHIYILFIVIV